jgi:hypothetical protein
MKIKYFLFLFLLIACLISVSLSSTLNLDKNGNLSFSGTDLNHYYILQNSPDLYSWNNLCIFYNQTNSLIYLTQKQQFYRLKIIDATTVKLIWNSNNDSAIDHVNLYYGSNPSFYDNSINVGNVTSTIVSNLVPNITYYFAVNYSDTNNCESELSNQVIYNKEKLLNNNNNN